MTCLSGRGSIFWMWAISGCSVHSHKDHMVSPAPYTEITGVFLCLCWVTSGTHTELCLIITCLFDTGALSRKGGKGCFNQENMWRKDSLCSGQQAGWEWLRPSLCLPVVKGANYFPCDSSFEFFCSYRVIKEYFYRVMLLQSMIFWFLNDLLLWWEVCSPHITKPFRGTWPGECCLCSPSTSRKLL